jgi:membrane complex biogenesis BtpA family protein
MVEAAALADARALASGGVHAIMVENFGDAPFHATTVEPVTIAAMTRIIHRIVEEVASTDSPPPPNSLDRPGNIPVGVNVLRNDAIGALSIAAATGARFIRVNVHVGAMLTDQGLIEGDAASTLRLREALNCGPGSPNPVAILADVGVKHARPQDPDWLLEQEASDCFHRGLADALIVSGAGTGSPTDATDLARLRATLPTATILVGSGLTLDNATTLLSIADGAIVGTALKEEGGVESPVCVGRVEKLVRVCDQPL